MNHSVDAVIVLYHPDSQVLETIESLAGQVNKVVIVINAVSDSLLQQIKSNSKVVVINNSSNVGLATALNAGLNYSFGILKSDFSVLFDQDSQPPVGFIKQLLNEFILSASFNLACIGPRLNDVKGGEAKYGKNNAQFEIRQPRSIPSSGTLISREAFLKIGPMMDALFIDGIDHEWCFRAYHLGFVIKVSDGVEMNHNMGDIGVKFFGEYKPIHRSPFRHYFIVRNSIYLASLSYIPLRWRVVELIKTVRRIFVYSFVSSNRVESIQLMLKAIYDGIFKKLGPLKTSSK